MNPRFLRYYSQELQHLREMGGEFAQDYPKIAGRLGLDSFECTDPYVERLLEGFSFLAARVQMKIDAEFPRFTQHMMELVYPQLLAPTPSMAVAQLQPDLSNPALQKGFVIKRGSAMRSVLGKGDNTACEYRSAHELTLWPLELVEARFITIGGAQAGLNLPATAKAGVRLRLRTGAAAFRDLPLDTLSLFLRGADALPLQLYETLLANVEGVLVTPVSRPAAWHVLLPKKSVRPRGFAAGDALLPEDGRSFSGYRLLREYFAFPQRFQFVDLSGLQAGLRHCADQEVEITILLNRSDAQLEKAVDTVNFALHCTPVVNLFERRADRINLSGDQLEYHVLVDRTRPMDYEVFHVSAVTGYGSGPGVEQAFQPFYTARDLGTPDRERAFYQIRHEQRLLSQRQRRDGPRSSYVGSETYISIVDAANAPYSTELRQLGLAVWCTNRDLPLSMPVGAGKTDFLLELGAPVQAVRCVAGPSEPRPSFAEGAVAWRLLNHLSLNYLSLLDTDPKQGAAALRDMLALYCYPGDVHGQRQIDALRSVSAKPITRRMPSPGPITFGRGIEVAVSFDDAAFEGAGAFLLGAVLAEFFAEYVSINTFTETLVRTVGRGPIMRWPAREGTCAIL